MVRKVVTPTALVSVLWLTVGAATLYYLNWVYDSHARDLAENFTTIQAADSMQDVLWRLQATAVEVAERADSHTRLEVTDLEETFERHLAEVEATSSTPETQQLAATLRDQFTQYRQYLDRRLDAPSTAGSPGPPPVEMARSAHAIAISCQNLLKVQERMIADSIAAQGRLASHSIRSWSFYGSPVPSWASSRACGSHAAFAARFRRSASISRTRRADWNRKSVA